MPPESVQPVNTITVQEGLLSWYREHGRSLPWRTDPDPYRIWISEVMLQQTRVETVIPYYERWMQRFPRLIDLAAADEQEVLQQWEGLGYYARARNILRCARILAQKHNGQLPEDENLLAALPGFGPYITGAVASMAFGIRSPALDGNIKRVLARLAEFRDAVNDEKNTQKLREMLWELLPQKEPGDFNQALMDLGAMVCLPRVPRCDDCPLKTECKAFQNGSQNQLPIQKKKSPVPLYEVAAAVMVNDQYVLIDKRVSGGLLGGLWEFPGGKVEAGETLAQALRREMREELGVEITVGSEFGIYRHAYTHFKVVVHAYNVEITAGDPQALESEKIEWALIAQLGDYPMGKVDRQIARDLQKRDG